jgi:hypothetical protein
LGRFNDIVNSSRHSGALECKPSARKLHLRVENGRQIHQEPAVQVGTPNEVLQLLSDNRWNCGIKVDDTNLYYDVPEANCLDVKWPDSPGRAAYFSWKASRLGLDGDEAQFHGALLWVPYAELGSLAPIGWKLVEKMRQGFGENRPLQAANAHLFRRDELLDLKAFLLPCFVFGWDAYLVPFGRNDFFVHISHDEYWGVVSRTREAYDNLLSELQDLNPTESPSMRKRFASRDKKGRRGSKHPNSWVN